MDAPTMLTRKHVPEDVGTRNIVEEDAPAGEQQLHRDEKQQKPVLKKVKDKVKKIKSTLAGNGHGEERVGGGGAGGSSSEEGEEDMLEREAATEKGGYMDDVEDKPAAVEADPEVHGAPMYESARAPAVQELVAKYEPARTPAAQEVQRQRDAAPRVPSGVTEDPAAKEAPGVRLGNDLGGPAVEDPAAPRSTTPAAREGEDIGTTPVVQEFESMALSDDPAHVGAGKKGAREEECKDAGANTDGASGGASYTEKLKNATAAPTEYGKKLATTVYDKVAGTGGAAVGAGMRDDEHPEQANATPVMSDSDLEERNDAPAATGAAGGAGYTGKIKSAAAGTTEYGKQLATAAYEKAAGAGTAVVGKVQQATTFGTATSGVGAGEPESGQDTGAPAMTRKEDAGGSVAQREPAPTQMITKAREAVTSLTGGDRVSETVQPNAATGTEVKEHVAAEAPVLRGQEIGEAKLNTNAM